MCVTTIGRQYIIIIYIIPDGCITIVFFIIYNIIMYLHDIIVSAFLSITIIISFQTVSGNQISQYSSKIIHDINIVVIII